MPSALEFLLVSPSLTADDFDSIAGAVRHLSSLDRA